MNSQISLVSAASRRSRSFRRHASVLAVALLLVSAPAAVQASPETLQRSIGNIVQTPLDIALAPVVAGRTLINNLRDIDDTTPVKVAFAVPGYFWLVGLQVGGGAMRGIAGLLELIPGLILLPFATDLDALYDPADRGGSLVEIENPLAEHDVARWFPLVTWNVRFGVTYTSAEY